MTAGAADSKILNQPVTFESNRIRIVRFEFESNLEASQVPKFNVPVTGHFRGQVFPANHLAMVSKHHQMCLCKHNIFHFISFISQFHVY